MSQTQLLPSSSAPSFPPLAYKGIPVLTTEMLAQAYDVVPKQIRQNFANNRERFIEGKHFFSLLGQELKDFRLCVENFDSQISTKVRALILYTARGCARHAKSLNTDRAWDMYELLEETFFTVKPDANSSVPPTGTLSRISSRTIAGELHKRHSTVLDAISRAAAVCPQRDAFVRGNYVDAKGQRCPQYMVSREGIIFLSQSYAARQTDAWRNILDTLSTVPEVVTRRPVPQRLPGLPATERLFADIEKALFALDGTENWTHITVRRELSGIGSVPFEVEKAIKHHINAAWYSLGLAQSSLQAALALRKLA